MWQTILPYINSLFVCVMVITFVLAIYQIAKFIRTKKDVRKAWHRARGRFFFGIFLIAFALNQIILFPTLLTFIICAVLLVFGLANISYGRKAMPYFEQHFAKEDRAWEEINK